MIEIKSWCRKPESGAKIQAENLAKLPFAFKHVALMPDTHEGYGMPIGAVLTTKGVVIPNAVGVDIGCGMCAVKSSLTKIDQDPLKKIMSRIRELVPVGRNSHKKPQEVDLGSTSLKALQPQLDRAKLQVGTLGGGNHFIEIQQGNDGHIWIMIHSGSRNLGKTTADHYDKLARELNAQWHSSVPKEWELAFLPLDSLEGQEYVQAMNYCVDFAFKNRRLMLDRIQQAFAENMEVEFEPEINIAHNYARMEHHFGHNVMVHRKGATSAQDGEIGIIPGSQGSKSYIVKGKGNIFSFKSCSHGAGRKMGRKEAQRTLNLAQEQRLLDSLGVIHAVRGVRDLDEAPGSYKDIDVVIQEQKDLVDILVELRPLAVVKG